MTKAKQKPIYDCIGPPANWLCDCKDSTIRWIDKKRPHPAVTGPGWFCTGCLTEYIPSKMHRYTCAELHDEQKAHAVTKGRAFQMEMEIKRLVSKQSSIKH
jgi:hypothetical protein